MTRAVRLLDSMRANPKADWTPGNVRTVAREGVSLNQLAATFLAQGLAARQGS